jgi:hypothetical protein
MLLQSGMLQISFGDKKLGWSRQMFRQEKSEIFFPKKIERIKTKMFCHF